MDKALVFGTKDCRFESCQGHMSDWPRQGPSASLGLAPCWREAQPFFECESRGPPRGGSPTDETRRECGPHPPPRASRLVGECTRQKTDRRQHGASCDKEVFTGLIAQLVRAFG